MSKAKVKKSYTGFLEPGSSIGVLGLSGAINPELLTAGIESVKSYGFDVVMPLDPSLQYGKSEHMFSTASVSARVNSFHQLIRNPKVGAILAVRGAYGSMELLPFIDYKLVKRFPKPLVGISDFAAVLAAVYKKSKSITIHGPTLQSSFSKAGKSVGAKLSAERLLGYLRGEIKNPFSEVKLEPIFQSAKSVSGPLFGGNLTMLASLIGTPWDVDLAGHILFLEDVGERPFRIHRMLMRMKLAGKFKKVRAVLLGSFSGCEHPNGLGPTTREVFVDIFKPLKIPLFAGLPIGHDEINYPIPIGINARVRSNKLEI